MEYIIDQLRDEDTQRQIENTKYRSTLQGLSDDIRAVIGLWREGKETPLFRRDYAPKHKNDIAELLKATHNALETDMVEAGDGSISLSLVDVEEALENE
jgi:hypothetical protein